MMQRSKKFAPLTIASNGNQWRRRFAPLLECALSKNQWRNWCAIRFFLNGALWRNGGAQRAVEPERRRCGNVLASVTDKQDRYF
jgi:hypothetical protein